MSAAADENGFSDIRFIIYSYLSGENAGKLMAVVEAPSGNRLGAMLDALESDWASPYSVTWPRSDGTSTVSP